MSVSNKLRAVLNLCGAKPADLSGCLNKSVQSVRNKFSQDSFSVADVLRICDYLGCELSIRTNDGQTVILTIDDVRQDTDGTEQKSNAMDTLILKAVLNPDIPPESTKVITEEDVKNEYQLQQEES